MKKIIINILSFSLFFVGTSVLVGCKKNKIKESSSVSNISTNSISENSVTSSLSTSSSSQKVESSVSINSSSSISSSQSNPHIHSYEETSYTWENDYCIAYTICDGCGEEISERVLANYVIENDSSCSNDEVGYWEASFTNPNFIKQITASKEKANTKLQHSYVDINYIWNEEGKCLATARCENCSFVLREETIGSYYVDEEATCEHNEIDHLEASFDNDVFEKQISTSFEKEGTIKEHIYNLPKYVWNDSECVGYSKCLNCSHEISEEGVVITSIVEEGTCSLGALERKEATFTNSLFENQFKDERLAPEPHQYGDIITTWNGSNCHAQTGCEVCEYVLTSDSTSSTYVVDTQGGCVSNSKGHYIANMDNPYFGTIVGELNSIEKEDSSKGGHIFVGKTPTYSWSEDCITCLGSIECSRCGELIEETKEASLVRNIEATCESDGVKEYSVKFDNECLLDASKTIISGALGHDLSTTTTKEATIYLSGLETTNCSRCDYSISNEIPVVAYTRYQNLSLNPYFINGMTKDEAIKFDIIVVNDKIYSIEAYYSSTIYGFYQSYNVLYPTYEDDMLVSISGHLDLVGDINITFNDYEIGFIEINYIILGVAYRGEIVFDNDEYIITYDEINGHRLVEKYVGYNLIETTCDEMIYEVEYNTYNQPTNITLRKNDITLFNEELSYDASTLNSAVIYQYYDEMDHSKCHELYITYSVDGNVDESLNDINLDGHIYKATMYNDKNDSSDPFVFYSFEITYSYQLENDYFDMIYASIDCWGDIDYLCHNMYLPEFGNYATMTSSNGQYSLSITIDESRNEYTEKTIENGVMKELYSYDNALEEVIDYCEYNAVLYSGSDYSSLFFVYEKWNNSVSIKSHTIIGGNVTNLEITLFDVDMSIIEQVNDEIIENYDFYGGLIELTDAYICVVDEDGIVYRSFTFGDL